MPIRAHRPFPVATLLSFACFVALSLQPAVALENVSPGGTVNFQTADGCSTVLRIPNAVESLARTHADCDASQRLLKAETRPINGAYWIGLQTVSATAVLRNDFTLLDDAQTTGDTVGAWISYDAHWNGSMLFVGFFSPPTVEFAIRLRDVTDGNKVIKSELIWGRDGKGAGISVPYIPFDLNLGGGVDSNRVLDTFPAVLTRGHTYRIEMLLTCSVFSDGGLDVGSECDYMDDYLVVNHNGGAGWSALSVKVGLDEMEVQRKLDALANHTHNYLTGRGAGHNNTTATTSAPLDSGSGSTNTGSGPTGNFPGRGRNH